MRSKCDLFLPVDTVSVHLRFLRIFDKGFLYEEGRSYFGYLGVSVDRVKLVSVVIELRKQGVEAYSVPIKYIDGSALSKSECFAIAKKHASSKGDDVLEEDPRLVNEIPVFWAFSLIAADSSKVGGVVHIDILDGHVWDYLECEEYMYDYNAIL